MSLQDSDPERRNLLVASLGFIAYYYAGGSFPENVIRIQVINISFSDPNFLGFLAWSLLLWFAYRYWLTHKGIFIAEYREEISKHYQKQYVRKYASNKLGKPYIEEGFDEGIRFEGLSYDQGKPVIRCKNVTSVNRNEITGEIESWSSKGAEKLAPVSLDTLSGLWVRIRVTIECCISSPSFSSYLVPYLVFAIALLGPLYAKAL